MIGDIVMDWHEWSQRLGLGAVQAPDLASLIVVVGLVAGA